MGPSAAADIALAVDLGATKTAIALVRRDGTILARARLATPQAGARPAADAIVGSLRRLLQDQHLTPGQVAGVGLASAGLCNPQTGVVARSPNLPDWKDVPLAGWVRDGLGVPVLLANDANAAALGELHYGAGRGLSDFVYITVSSGIGGGLVLGGKLYLGHSFTAGEVGHMVVAAEGPACGCGSRGCLEAVASGLAIARRAVQRLEKGEASLLRDMAEGAPANMTAELVHRAALAGDGLSRALIEEAGRYLGIGCASLVNLLAPQAIIIGGGLSRMGEMLLCPARIALREHAYTLAVGDCELLITPLGDDNGLLGAATVVFDA